MTALASTIKEALAKESCQEKAQLLSRYFKTGPGHYGEGDVFWGIPVPTVRAHIKPYPKATTADIVALLADPIHEVRLAGGLLLVHAYQKAKDAEKAAYYACYIAHATRFNNWDLVDLTAYHVVGDWLYDKDRTPLYKLAASSNLWEQRIAIVSTLFFIRKEDYTVTLELAKGLQHHPHDLIQKAVGWMLREVGKRDIATEKAFLLEEGRYLHLPRTLLRYAIERFPEQERQLFLKGSHP